MPVVVNEFEVVPAPEAAPAEPDRRAQPPAPGPLRLADEIERALARSRERTERLHAD